MDSMFTGDFETVGDWYIGCVEELPGANTQGRTLEEAGENLREAIELVLVANRELAQSAESSTCPHEHSSGRTTTARLLRRRGL